VVQSSGEDSTLADLYTQMVRFAIHKAINAAGIKKHPRIKIDATGVFSSAFDDH